MNRQRSCYSNRALMQMLVNKVPAANSEGAKVASHSMNNLWQCQSFVDNVSIDSWQCQLEIDKVKSMKTVIVGFKADLDFSDIRSQIFVHFEADSNFSQYLSATIRQLNKMCSTFEMVATEHKPIYNSYSSTFRFIVGFKQQHKLISASRHQQLIVAYVNTNSKISLYFCKDCRIFCKGVKDDGGIFVKQQSANNPPADKKWRRSSN
jgi:hypothetical protein